MNTARRISARYLRKKAGDPFEVPEDFDLFEALGFDPFEEPEKWDAMVEEDQKRADALKQEWHPQFTDGMKMTRWRTVSKGHVDRRYGRLFDAVYEAQLGPLVSHEDWKLIAKTLKVSEAGVRQFEQWMGGGLMPDEGVLARMDPMKDGGSYVLRIWSGNSPNDRYWVGAVIRKGSPLLKKPPVEGMKQRKAPEMLAWFLVQARNTPQAAKKRATYIFNNWLWNHLL